MSGRSVPPAFEVAKVFGAFPVFGSIPVSPDNLDVDRRARVGGLSRLDENAFAETVERGCASGRVVFVAAGRAADAWAIDANVATRTQSRAARTILMRVATLRPGQASV